MIDKPGDGYAHSKEAARYRIDIVEIWPGNLIFYSKLNCAGGITFLDINTEDFNLATLSQRNQVWQLLITWLTPRAPDIHNNRPAQRLKGD